MLLKVRNRTESILRIILNQTRPNYGDRMAFREGNVYARSRVYSLYPGQEVYYILVCRCIPWRYTID